MRNAFIAVTQHLPIAEGVSLFDTCDDLSDQDSMMVPGVHFHFSAGQNLPLPANNYLVLVIPWVLISSHLCSPTLSYL